MTHASEAHRSAAQLDVSAPGLLPASAASNHAGAPGTLCMTCSRRLSARTARIWPQRPAMAAPMAQDFLSCMRWDADAMRNDLRADVADHPGDLML